MWSHCLSHLRGISDSGEPMCNDQHRPTLHGPVNCLLYQMLTLCIKSTCSLGREGKEEGREGGGKEEGRKRGGKEEGGRRRGGREGGGRGKRKRGEGRGEGRKEMRGGGGEEGDSIS